jgi:hypothetical protein
MRARLNPRKLSKSILLLFDATLNHHKNDIVLLFDSGDRMVEWIMVDEGNGLTG